MIKAIASYILYPLVERQQKRQILPKLKQLNQFSALSSQQRLRLNQQRLYEAVAIAGQRVPYYRDLFQQQKFQPEKLKTDARYLKDLPYLTKDVLREHGDRLLHEQIPRTALHVRKTGGSTGLSALIYYDQSALDWTAAANLFVLEWAGKKRHMKEVHFSSRFPDPIPHRDKIKESIKCVTLNRTNITTDTFDADALRDTLKAIRQAHPYLVQGHPSTLYMLALQAKRDSIPTHDLFHVFESTGEVLDHKKFRTISRVFQCKVHNRYGNAEFGVVAHTREADSQYLEVLTDIVLPETRPGLENSGLENAQELVFTSLTNHAMPLIRYCTGDIGQLSQRNERMLISQIVGRVHDLVKIDENVYPTHYIQDFLDRIGGIDEFQLEQIGNNHLKLRLVLMPSADLDRIHHRITNQWGSNIAIECVNADELKLQGWRHKFRHLVNPISVE